MPRGLNWNLNLHSRHTIFICSDWGQEEKGTTEDEMAGLHYQFGGHEFE